MSTNKKSLKHFSKYSYVYVLIVMGAIIYLGTFLSSQTFLSFLAGAKAGPVEATKTTYTKRLLALMYIPDINEDGIVDPDISGYSGYVDVIHDKKYGIKISDMKKKLLDQINYGVKYFTNATKYHGYSDSSAKASIEYKIDSDKIFEYYTTPPRGKKVGTDLYNPNYKEMLEKINICNYIDNKGVSEIWIFTQDKASIKPLQSNMYSDELGDISDDNSDDDLPKCNNTYFVYNFNITKGLDEMIEIKAKHLAKLLSKTNGSLFGSKFVAACGTAVRPVNESSDHKYNSGTKKSVDCEDFKPDRSGIKRDVSCNTWSKSFFGSDSCKDDKGFSYHMWWMQNIPGYGNILYDGTRKVRNWWDYIGDIDQVYEKKGYLYLAADEFDPNNTSQEGAPKMRMTSPSGSKVEFPFTVRWDKISEATDYQLKIDDLEHHQTAYNKTYSKSTSSTSINLSSLKDYKKLENDDKIRVTITAKTLAFGNLSASKEFRVKDVEDKNPTPTPTPTPKPTVKKVIPTRKPTSTPTKVPISTPQFPKEIKIEEPKQVPFPTGSIEPVDPAPVKPNSAAQILFPLSVNLPAKDINVTWSIGTNVRSYQLIVGKSSDSNEFGPKDTDTKPKLIENAISTYSVGGLPADGSDVYIGIRTNYIDGGSFINSRVYKSYSESIGGEPVSDDKLDSINTDADLEESPSDTEPVGIEDSAPAGSSSGSLWSWLLKILSIITFGLVKDRTN